MMMIIMMMIMIVEVTIIIVSVMIEQCDDDDDCLPYRLRQLPLMFDVGQCQSKKVHLSAVQQNQYSAPQRKSFKTSCSAMQ